MNYFGQRKMSRNHTLEELDHTMAKTYRKEVPASNGQKKLLIVFGVLLAIFLFTGLVYPGFWL